MNKKILLNVLKLNLTALILHSSSAMSCYNDPLIIDLGGDGLTLGDPGRMIHFDMLGNNKPVEMQWVGINSDEAFLAIDNNGNGLIDDGTELFGNGTILHEDRNTIPANGFVALSQYDKPELGGNDDGKITKKDSVWTHLVLWNDLDADGVSTADEIYGLNEYGLTSISIIPIEMTKYDAAGNLLAMRSKVKAEEDGERVKFKMYDVIFASF